MEREKTMKLGDALKKAYSKFGYINPWSEVKVAGYEKVSKSLKDNSSERVAKYEKTVLSKPHSERNKNAKTTNKNAGKRKSYKTNVSKHNAKKANRQPRDASGKFIKKG
jgi:hypothetical protein